VKSLTIIVPALNEEQNLQPAISEIIRCIDQLGVEYEILLFNDCSTDETGTVADSLARSSSRIQVFHNERRLNIGGIYKAGIRRARYEYCLLLPGDNEVLVEEVVKSLRLLDQADLAVTYIANQDIRPFIRRFLSRCYTIIVNTLFGLSFKYTNGSNTCRTDLLREIEIKTEGFSYQTETLVKLVRQGVNFVEVGVNLRGRAHGKSSALALRNWIKVFKAIATLWWDVRISNRHLYNRIGRKIAIVA